jgi:hypothetical protein
MHVPWGVFSAQSASTGQMNGRGQGRSNLAEEFDLFVGIDWASESHEVCVLDRERRVVDRKTIEHSGAGMTQLCDLLLRLSNHKPSRVAVAIETPRGAVVETLVERQFKVFAINPKQIDRFRDRHTGPAQKMTVRMRSFWPVRCELIYTFFIRFNWMKRR